MSSFSAIFKFDGKEYEVLTTNYSFHQLTDDKGRPASAVKAGDIAVSLVVGDDEKILEWAVDSDKKSSGSIIYKKIDQDSTLKELKFEDAYCHSYSEGFTANMPDSMVANIGISARKITIGNVPYEVRW
jgi:hypothetical protein